MAEIAGFREFLRKPWGKIAGIVFVLAMLGVAGYVVRGFFLPDSTVAAANSPLFIDAETGQTFHQTLEDGMKIPLKSPFTGKYDAYKAELCYWTKDGKPKTEPTAVLMNDDVGKPGPTFCKDCGRLVKHHNPAPGPNSKPPPTEAEYNAKDH